MEIEKISELDTLATAEDSDVLVINDVSESDTMKITKQNLLKEIKAEIDGIKEILYPVGYVYISVSDTNPATTLGIGTWQQIKDTFLLCAGDTYSIGATGGSATKTLKISEMPNHNHTIGNYSAGVADGGSVLQRGWSAQTVLKVADTSYVGGGEAFSIMPPYLAVYVWKRVS